MYVYLFIQTFVVIVLLSSSSRLSFLCNLVYKEVGPMAVRPDSLAGKGTGIGLSRVRSWKPDITVIMHC